MNILERWIEIRIYHITWKTSWKSLHMYGNGMGVFNGFHGCTFNSQNFWTFWPFPGFPWEEIPLSRLKKWMLRGSAVNSVLAQMRYIGPFHSCNWFFSSCKSTERHIFKRTRNYKYSKTCAIHADPNNLAFLIHALSFAKQALLWIFKHFYTYMEWSWFQMLLQTRLHCSFNLVEQITRL